MKVYFNCYTIGEGYTLKEGSWPDAPELREISRRQLPEAEREIFTGPGAPHLFLGSLEGGRFGCVRNIETELRDENGRRCFLHLAWEGQGADASLVNALTRYACDYRGSFVKLCNESITYSGSDYLLRREGFQRLVQAAQAVEGEGGEPYYELLIPETSTDLFFNSVPSLLREESFAHVLSPDEWRRREVPMELFLYCSTPSSGFTLSQIDPVSGQKLKTRKEANDALTPYSRIILTHSGAKLALFEQNGQVCFVCKDIQSTHADRYGMKKNMSLVAQASVQQALPVRQLAAWALVDFTGFSEQLTDCVHIYNGTRGYEVDGDRIARFVGQVQTRLAVPEGLKARKVWEQAVSPAQGKQFFYLVLEASLAYFCRTCQIQAGGEQIGLTLTEEEFEQLQRTPAALSFAPIPATPSQQAQPEPAARQAPVKGEDKQPEPAARQAPAKGEDKQPEPAERERKEGQKAPIQPAQKTKAAPAETSQSTGGGSGDGEDSVNLLKTGWFLPAVIIGVIVIVAVILFFAATHMGAAAEMHQAVDRCILKMERGISL